MAGPGTEKMNNRRQSGKKIALIILAVIAVLLIGLSFARYITSASGSDSARVAKFDVTQSCELDDDFSVEMSPTSKPEVFDIEVTNSSEVPIHCSYETDVTGNIPLTVDGSGSFDLQPGESDTDHTVTIKWDSKYKGAEYSEGVAGIKITLTSTQID